MTTKQLKPGDEVAVKAVVLTPIDNQGNINLKLFGGVNFLVSFHEEELAMWEDGKRIEAETLQSRVEKYMAENLLPQQTIAKLIGAPKRTFCAWLHWRGKLKPEAEAKLKRLVQKPLVEYVDEQFFLEN